MRSQNENTVEKPKCLVRILTALWESLSGIKKWDFRFHTSDFIRIQLRSQNENTVEKPKCLVRILTKRELTALQIS